MLGTQARCPNMVEYWRGELGKCGCPNFRILERKVFDSKDGYDPLAQKVVCNECGHIYLMFPAVNYKEKVLNVHNSR